MLSKKMSKELYLQTIDKTFQEEYNINIVKET